MNSVILIGRLTADPDVRYTRDELCIANFNVAVDRRAGKDGNKEADFPRVKAFGKTAEFIEKYFQKGSKIVIQGRLQTGSYEDKETGRKVFTTDVIADNVEFGESKKDGDGGSKGSSRGSGSRYDDDIPEGFEEEDDDIPF